MIMIQNSAFKVKAEVVQSHEGIVPERGAILFLEDDNVLIYGDGFNWLNIGGVETRSALALALLTPVVVPYIGGTPKQSVFYDTVVYNVLTGFTPATGNQITFNKDMTFDFSADYEIQADVPQVTYTQRTYLDAVMIAERHTHLGQANEAVQIVVLGSIPVLNTQVLTIVVECDKSCNLTTNYANSGLHEQV